MSMRTNEWYISLIIIVASYLSFVFFSDFRFLFLIFFAFVFSGIISRDERRLGRVVLQTIVPLLISIVIFFSAALLAASLRGELLLQTSQMAVVAIAFLSMLLLCALVGTPLAWAGAQTRLLGLISRPE